MEAARLLLAEENGDRFLVEAVLAEALWALALLASLAHCIMEQPRDLAVVEAHQAPAVSVSLSLFK